MRENLKLRSRELAAWERRLQEDKESLSKEQESPASKKDEIKVATEHMEKTKTKLIQREQALDTAPEADLSRRETTLNDREDQLIRRDETIAEREHDLSQREESITQRENDPSPWEGRIRSILRESVGVSQVRRQDLDGECCICLEDLNPVQRPVMFCDTGCGANIYRDCVDSHVAESADTATPWLRVWCPACQGKWQ
ncbi:hypothetical protein BDV96DRAFT_655362 [Lophiotrema nucula]|uniref:RING-type domain-containing protein n=1 Tax=Lophiotrema nucula TaxID=690887 RepID=A0A6A5YFL0_9PLEO|nr:hypothetical protein BDV96DRAFT_655362 [Lophiotrema nucula]